MEEDGSALRVSWAANEFELATGLAMEEEERK